MNDDRHSSRHVVNVKIPAGILTCETVTCAALRKKVVILTVLSAAAALRYITSSFPTAVGIQVPAVGPGNAAVTVRNTLASESRSSRVPTVSQSHGTLQDVGPGHSISSR